MKAILCPECGHEINKHMDIYSPGAVCHGADGKNFCKCMLTPQEIAAYHITNTLRKIEDTVNEFGADSPAIISDYVGEALHNMRASSPAQPLWRISRTWADKHLNSDDDLKYFPGGAEVFE